MAFLSRNSESIGLDIGKASLVAVQLAGSPPQAVLKKYHERLIPEGVVFEGEVLDPDALGNELKSFAKEVGLKKQPIHFGVGNQKVVVRNIEVPDMDEEELRGAIEFQAQDYIPIPVDEAVLDFQVINRFTDEEGAAKQQVLLVAAQRDMIGRFTQAAQQAGLNLAGIDVSAFALIRALAPSVSFVDRGATGEVPAVGIVNIGSSVSTLVVAEEEVPKFTRIINFAFDDFTQVLVDQQGILGDDAIELTRRVGLSGPREPDAETYNPATVEETRQILAGAAEGLAEEVRRSLDYYQSQDYSAPVDHLLIAGVGSLLLNLDSYLSEFLGLHVETGNPLEKISGNQSDLSDEELQAIAPRLAVAVGLALEEED